MSPADRFDWDAWPLIPAVVQNPVTNQVLMVGFMNREALERSVSTGHVTFYSRS
ncbi:MAG: bifunctional phosphoribosyl-AMP cyclohydrolase/phosphoribosyl-ATP diphosphatase, partial [Thermomicrobiales bacterium]|nr:bifunctional phosphoribosyl-AMP cyclohydrolase/phosphoribosyl-ATP diphosphatase [Thermomicrobiales bacterium]